MIDQSLRWWLGSSRAVRRIAPQLPATCSCPSLLKPILTELIQSGTSKRERQPWLGITSQEREGRVFISKVQTDGPAERAGLRAGDILLTVGGVQVGKLEELYAALWRNTKAGDEITLTVLQGSEVRKIIVSRWIGSITCAQSRV